MKPRALAALLCAAPGCALAFLRLPAAAAPPAGRADGPNFRLLAKGGGAMPPTNPVRLVSGAPVEYWADGGVSFANFAGVTPGKSSLKIVTAQGEDATIDAGQLVGIWTESDVQSRLPRAPDDWRMLSKRSQERIERIPAQCLDMDGLWAAARRQGGGKGKANQLTITAVESARWLFGMGGKWGKHRDRLFSFSASANEEGIVYVPTAEERMAGANALAAESHRFKRVPSRCTSPPTKNGDLDIYPGGFRAVDASVKTSNEVLSFVELARAAHFKSDEIETQPHPTHLVMLHGLEVLAMGGDVSLLSSECSRALELLSKPATMEGAREALLEAGYWSASQGNGPSVDHSSELSKMVVPWSENALKAAQILKENIQRQAQGRKAPRGAVGSPAPFGRFDYREAPFTVFCIDAKETGFPDDAMSFDVDRKDVLIHIADVQGRILKGSELDEVAKNRVSTTYLPKGPMFMLPPPALQALSFSSSSPNEAITIAFKLNPETMSLEPGSGRAMLTLLPPATMISYETANGLLESGVRKGKAAELMLLAKVASQSRSDGHTQRPGASIMPDFETSPAHSMIDSLLALYSAEALRICKRAGVALPVLVGLKDYVSQGRSRFGTGPLRRYIDILAQRQLAAILKGKGYLTRTEVNGAVDALTKHRNRVRALESGENLRQTLEALELHCARKAQAMGSHHATLDATATGRSREVLLDEFGLQVNARKPSGNSRKREGGAEAVGGSFSSGARIRVRILSVSARSGSVVAEETV
jgi:hypothetical protein